MEMATRLPRRLALREAAQHTGEIPDTTPIEVGEHQKPLTLREEMRRFIIQEVSTAAEQHGVESFEEADDFDVEEETDLTSPYTVQELYMEGAPRDDLEGEPNKEDKQAENGQQEPPEETEGDTGVNRKGVPLGQQEKDLERDFDPSD
ncbi:hypothetical protein [Microviridae sp.]|nr:hypothetical protein [Microviridae sp.]